MQKENFLQIQILAIEAGTIKRFFALGKISDKTLPHTRLKSGVCLDGAMDSFKIHSNVIADYRGYIESFINIRDQGILAVVQKALSEGRLWPEPLIQFNPSYKITGDLAAVVANEKLHPLLTDIFKGYRLYQHQMEALRLGTSVPNN